MTHPTGESESDALRFDFDRRLMPSFAASWSRPMRDCWRTANSMTLRQSVFGHSWLDTRALHPEFAGVSRVWRRGMQTEERFLDFGFEKWPAYLDILSGTSLRRGSRDAPVKGTIS
jgi:hypothetical protein